MKIWFLSELYWPSKTSTAFILTKIAEGVVADGDVNIGVITGPPTYDQKHGEYKLDEVVNSVNILRVRMPYLDKNKLLTRMLRLSYFTLKIAIRALRTIKKESIVVAVTTPISLVLISIFLKKFGNVSRVMLIVHDVYPDNMVVAGLTRKGGFLYKILDRVFVSAFSKVDSLVVLGRDMKAVLEKKGLSNINIIENWAEPELLCEPALPVSRLERDETVFLMAGNLGRVQGIVKLLDAIDLIHNPSVKFIFAGDGATGVEVAKRARSTDQIDYLGKYDRDEQAKIFATCDVGVVSLTAGMFGLAVPSKSYNLMAAGKPLLYIGDPGSELDLVIKETDCGWFCDASSTTAALAEYINIVASSTNKEIYDKSRNSYKLGFQKYTEVIATSSFKKLISTI